MKKFFSFVVAFMVTSISLAQIVETVYEKSNFTEEEGLPWKDYAVQVSFEDGVAVLTNNAAIDFWQYQYQLISDVSLDTNKEYTVTLTGKAEGTGTANIRYRVGDWTGFADGSFSMTAGEDYKDYSFKFTPTEARNILILQHGDFVGTIRWKKVTISYAETSGLQKVLVITSTADKTENYESQVFINLPTMTKGQEYHVKFYAKSTANFTFGSEAIDDKQTEHKTQYNASAVFNYTAGGDVTSEYKPFYITLPGKTDLTDCKTDGHTNTDAAHTNFEYAATALLLNIGKLPKDAVFTISNISLFDKDWKWVDDVDITTIGPDDKNKSVYYPGWQGTRTVTTEYVEPIVTLNGKGFATYSCKDNVSIKTSGVTAYKASVTGETITLTALNGYIPAGTGVLLYSETTGKIVEFASPASGATAADVTGNVLKATTNADGSLAAKEDNSWALSTQDETGNQFLSYTGDAYVHNRAYLVHTTTSGARYMQIVFGGDVTAIDDVFNDAPARDGKLLQNGRIVILKNGVKYNAFGQVIK